MHRPQRFPSTDRNGFQATIAAVFKHRSFGDNPQRFPSTDRNGFKARSGLSGGRAGFKPTAECFKTG
jgi:hypothetical protein